MKVCGIIAEYNPFHNGHALHIENTKKLLGDDTFFICVMSGNYTQRGEPSIMPKHIRARSAILNGIDLVIELPTPYALMSAEGFAKSGVFILNSLGIVTDISFGAETSDIAQLIEISKLLLEHQVIQKTLLELKSGISYAAARERALYSLIKEKANIVSLPNNILAIEYIKAICSLSSDISPHAIPRFGSGHDSLEPKDGTLSASAIRHSLRNGSISEIEDFIPHASFNIIEDAYKNGLLMFDNSIFERNMFSYLLRLSSEDFKNCCDVSEGLENRIHKILHSSSCVSEAEELIRSKRYPLSRIRRALLSSYLGLNKAYVNPYPEYARVLAFNDRGRLLIKEMRDKASIPIITKPAHIQNTSNSALWTFEKESLCTDLYYSTLPMHKNYIPGIEWRLQAVKL